MPSSHQHCTVSCILHPKGLQKYWIPTANIARSSIGDELYIYKRRSCIHTQGFHQQPNHPSMLFHGLSMSLLPLLLLLLLLFCSNSAPPSHPLLVRTIDMATLITPK
ncbi:unnamed protein product, partial [Vitis vinifera]